MFKLIADKVIMDEGSPGRSASKLRRADQYTTRSIWMRGCLSPYCVRLWDAWGGSSPGGWESALQESSKRLIRDLQIR